MASYATRHDPIAGAGLCRLMGYEVGGSEDDYAAVGERVPFTQLIPDGHR